MTEAQAVQAMYFGPLAYCFYLLLVMVATGIYYQLKWAKRCREYVKVIVAKSDGSTDVRYAPKSGGSITLENPHTKTMKVWPITQLATIDMLYPGDGFIPVFLQKTIRTTIVSEEDWEPMLNRGAYDENVASPDVKDELLAIAEMVADEKLKNQIVAYTDNLRTASTRELIGSPELLGNLMQEKISELVVTVAKDIMNPINEAIKRMGKQVNANFVYIGLGLTVLLLAFLLFKVVAMAKILGA